MPIPADRFGGVLGAVCLTLVVTGCGEPTAEERIADTMRKTEDIRGLSALEPVPYRFLKGDAAFDQIIDDWRESDDARKVEEEALIMERLGLLPPGFDIIEVLEWSTRSGVLGYYDPDAARITVVGNEADIGPGHLAVLAHEHAHALQDQHFGLGEDLGLVDDAAAALDALVEGEATVVMAVWAMKRLGATELEELDASDIPTDVVPLAEIPPILYRAGEFPYADGAAFVFKQWDGDWDAVDRLWADPPRSTEQIMHPERYPDDVPVEVELPDLTAPMGPGWQAESKLVVGEMQIGVLLADGEPWGETEEDEAFAFPQLEGAEAAEGWGGDRLVHLTGPDREWAIVWQTTWDRPIDATEFAWAAEKAFEDLPYYTFVSPGSDVTDRSLPHPVLVLVASDRETRVRLVDTVSSP